MIPLPAKFALAFAIPGLLISALFAALSGNGWQHSVLVVAICTVLSSLLGAIVFSALKALVPEFLELFEGMGGFSGLSGFSFGRSRKSAEFSEDELNDYASGMDSDQSDGQTAEQLAGASSAPPSKHFGDHILADKVKIKNEPRLMAQAIRTLLAKDD